MRVRSLAVAIFALCGCAGDLVQPERFLAGSTSTTCASGLDVEHELLVSRCGDGGCHGADTPAAGLDLVSPSVADRLLGVASTGCVGRPLIDPESPTGGVLLEKLGVPSCGARMPLLDEPLSADELACVRAWVAETVAGSESADAAMSNPRDAGAAPADGGAR